MFTPNVLSRRDLLRLSASGILAAPVAGWFYPLVARAAEQTAPSGKPRYKSCILLFMPGGPSHVDTFDPKPQNTTCEFKPISTTVEGVQVCEHLPKVAQSMRDIALLRGMSTGEGSHGRARFMMHTGYREGLGGVAYPSIGSIASAKLGQPGAQLPNFVAIGAGARGGRAYGPGFLGPFHAPLEVPDAALGIANLKPADAMSAFDRRAGLLQDIDKEFIDRVQTPASQAHQATYQAAAQLMHSEKVKAFDIASEPASVRAAYGQNPFGDACVLARRLVEAGVPFVEVSLGNWDTHRDNGTRIKALCGQVDPGLSALIADLKTRGLLDSTLVIWMGEFGRTPFVGKQGGRDHYPKAWTSVLAGGGLKTGQVIGRTDKQGGTVEDRPITTVDFMATVCKALNIDYTRNFQTREGRPIRIVDKGENLIKELFV